jgi:TonB-dependent SusC/RagA subfamily outer membrane receptor
MIEKNGKKCKKKRIGFCADTFFLAFPILRCLFYRVNQLFQLLIGNDDASIKVRGQGTLNDSSPLVIIDGAEASINTVNPQDIETMTVLKDAASSAIYGSRAANGVILITTKQGKSGKIKLDYNGYVSFTSPSIPSSMDPVSNYADYMEYINEGYRNSGMAEKFSAQTIQEWRDNEGKDAHNRKR